MVFLSRAGYKVSTRKTHSRLSDLIRRHSGLGSSHPDFKMVIGDRLRDIRKQKNFSQGEIEKRTGLLRCYISRVENGHTVPGVETLEKIARAFGVPIYQLFYDAERPLDLPAISPRKTRKDE